MPELPEVETVARGLAATLEGHAIVTVQQNRANLRIPFPPNLKQRLEGRRVVHIGRRAKYLLLSLDDGQILVVHLGMSGRFIIRHDPSLPLLAHDHLVLTADDGVVYVLNDPRRFGLVEMVAADKLDEHRLFAGLGPEPLGNAFNGKVLAKAFDGKKTPVKAALLDQRVVAGLGNIYVCEALFRANISPKRLAGSITKERIGPLVTAIKKVLKDAIAAGGSTLRDHAQATGDPGNFQHRFLVYGREGLPCKLDCPGTVKRIVQAGRSTFYCPKCQT
jgi:formamidopyrimidine-DNA glycosylase